MKTKAQYNAYMRTYMLARYHRRIKEAKEQLGGKCARCGTTENLQFDHIDASKKNFEIGAIGPGIAETKLQAELKLCQLLCVTCHQQKTCEDNQWLYAKSGLVHGTLAAYRYCRCDQCKAVKSAYSKKYNLTRTRARRQAVKPPNF